MPQEASTFFYLENGVRKGRVRVALRERPGGGRVCQVAGQLGALAAACSATTDAAGSLLRARCDDPGGRVREAERRGDRFRLTESAEGNLPLDGPLLTPLELLGWPGARLAAGRELRFLTLGRDALPVLDPIFVREVKDVGRVRRTVLEWRSRRYGARTGTLETDPVSGAALTVGPPFIDRLQRAAAPPKSTPAGESLILWRDGARTRLRATPDGEELTFVAAGRAPWGRLILDADRQPVLWERAARPSLRASVAADTIAWSRDPVETGVFPVPAGVVWTLAHAVAPALWDPAIPALAVGASVAGTLLLVRPAPIPFTLERLGDADGRRVFSLRGDGLRLEIRIGAAGLERLTGSGVEIVAVPA